MRLMFSSTIGVALVASLIEIFLYSRLTIADGLGDGAESGMSDLIVALACLLLIAVIKPSLLRLTTVYCRRIEKNIYEESFLSSISQEGSAKGIDESELITNVMINPLRIVTAIYIPLIFGLQSFLGGLILLTYMFFKYTLPTVILFVAGGLFILLLGMVVRPRLSRSSRIIHETTKTLKSLLSYIRSDIHNLTQSSNPVYIDRFGREIDRLSASSSLQLFYNNLPRTLVELGIYFILVFFASSQLLGLNAAPIGLEFAVFIVLVTRVVSVLNQVNGVYLSLESCKSQFTRFMELTSESRNSLDKSRLLGDISETSSFQSIDSIILRCGLDRVFGFSCYTLTSDLIIKKGRITFLAGDSGSGKSVFLRNLLNSSVSSIDNGSLLCEGVPDISSSILVGKYVYYIAQDYRVDGLSVGQIVELNSYSLKAFSETASLFFSRTRITDMCEDPWRFSVCELSGGEYQRLMLCLAVLSNKPVIVIDESIDGLETSLRRAAIKTLLSFNRAILIISHNTVGQIYPDYSYRLQLSDVGKREIMRLD